MYIVILLLLFLAIIFGPQWWASHILRKYGAPRGDFPGTGSQLAKHLLNRLQMSHVRVEVTDLGSHYDPVEKAVRLSQDYFEGNSLSAIVAAAHEVGHAIQDAMGYQPLYMRVKLVAMGQVAEKVGAGLMIAMPFVAILFHKPWMGALMTLMGLVSLGMSVVIHLVTLPVEFDASFKRALPILEKGDFLSHQDLRAARQILTACALTYVASSLASLLDLWRWLAILRR